MQPFPARGAIFDMDGLLLDTERIACRAWQHAADELGVSIDESVVLGMVGMHSSKVETYLTGELGPDFPVNAIRDTTHRHYLKLTEAPIPLKSGVHALFDWFRDRGIPIAVATSTRRSIAEHHLKAAGLWDYLSASRCGDEIVHPKPAPDIYLAAASALGVAAGDCFAFEDSNFGVKAAHSAGCRVAMIPDLRQPDAHTLTLEVPVFGSLHDALTWVQAQTAPEQV
ncbi:HAD family hydrolase [Jeongeupia chitinilytica]|uniref:Haloacid dehalogenase n=1 Tax=Jeongeupia chitinilytica TaxID=1041641 RepID=A0ABQ3GZZ3_9NEIS|nr:HAD family phosphatase [Jeongeupia chitinilytica]GHD63571.1 haloacid dehalogenase [Jeongeupia chitinilytica]